MKILDLQKHRFWYSLAWKVADSLPKRLIYPREYFEVINLLRRQDAGQDIEADIRIRLANILVQALTTVPYYMESGLDIDPQSISPENAYDVLAQFPYLDKSTIMDQPERFVSNKFKIDALNIYTSGGSTGQGVKLYRNLVLRLIERAFFDYHWGKSGWKPTLRSVRMASSGRKKEDEDPFSKMGNILCVSPYHLDDKWIGTIYETLNRYRTEFIQGYSSCVGYFVEYMMRNSLKMETVKGISLASERVTKRHLECIRKVFGDIPVVFHYGLGEITSLAWGFIKDGEIAYKFEKAYGYSENHVYPDGRHEIVGTSYWNNIMPLIRYRTQDFGKIVNGIMSNLDGRSQEFLVTHTGAKFPGFSISIDTFVWDYVEIFQVVQNEPGKIEFHIKPRSNYNPDVENKILEAQQKKWGGFFEMKIVVDDTIERTVSGKLRLIVNNIGKTETTTTNTHSQ